MTPIHSQWAQQKGRAALSKLRLLFVLVSLALGHQAAAADPAPAPPTAPSDNPRWLTRPDANDIGNVYPSNSKAQRTGGHVVMSCQVGASGSMTDCSIVSETPPDAAFGAAAIKLAPLFKLTPTTPSGKSVVGASIMIPLTFQPPS